LLNDTLHANPAVEAARHTVPKAGLKYQVTTMVAQAAGGPERYHGRSMKHSHQHLQITEVEWRAMLEDFHKTLEKFVVPKREQDELVVILESTKAGIVVASDQ
jgi:hemoglobin